MHGCLPLDTSCSEQLFLTYASRIRKQSIFAPTKLKNVLMPHVHALYLFFERLSIFFSLEKQ